MNFGSVHRVPDRCQIPVSPKIHIACPSGSGTLIPMSRDTDRVVVSKLDRTWTSSTFDVARLEATDAEAAGAHSAAMLATTPTATPPRMARPPECSLARANCVIPDARDH